MACFLDYTWIEKSILMLVLETLLVATLFLLSVICLLISLGYFFNGLNLTTGGQEQARQFRETAVYSTNFNIGS